MLTPVDIPLSLNLSSFVHMDAYDDTKKGAVYDLSSVVIHDGDSLDWGHYVTLVRRNVESSQGDGRTAAKSVWYKMNDHLVSVLDEKEALALARGSSRSNSGDTCEPRVECQGGVCRLVERSDSCSRSSSNASAYLVFYKKRK